MTTTFDPHAYILDAGWDYSDIEYADRHGLGAEDQQRIHALAPATLGEDDRQDWAIDAIAALESYCHGAVVRGASPSDHVR